ADLRDVLDLDYRSFNATLVALARPYAPFHNVEGQQSAFAAHLSVRRTSVVEALRAMHLALFDAGNDLPDYVAASSELARAVLRRTPSGDASVPALTPDLRWGDEFDLPSDALMDHRIEDWINAVGAHPAYVTTPLPLDDV